MRRHSRVKMIASRGAHEAMPALSPVEEGGADHAAAEAALPGGGGECSPHQDRMTRKTVVLALAASARAPPTHAARSLLTATRQDPKLLPERLFLYKAGRWTPPLCGDGRARGAQRPGHAAAHGARARCSWRSSATTLWWSTGSFVMWCSTGLGSSHRGTSKRAAVWRPIRTTRTPSTTPCRSWLGWRTKRWSSGHPGPGEGDEVVLAAAASSPRSFSTTP